MRQLTRLRNTTYLGSHPGMPGQRDKVDVIFFDVGIRLGRRRDVLVDLSWEEVVSLAADDREHLEKRVTVSRLLVLGIFALAAPKNESGSYLVIEAVDGTYVLLVPGLRSIELASGLQPLMRYPSAQSPGSVDVVDTAGAPPQRPEGDPHARLVQLESLRAAGLLTDDEYGQKRASIIAEL